VNEPLSNLLNIARNIARHERENLFVSDPFGYVRRNVENYERTRNENSEGDGESEEE
jgi:hypothetical protein